ncbi:hypothetical protein ACQKKX_06440 [Neorhizobium sp. NPDC001467]|uniref:hypothetical protein n=1 Tax=Neorhizobium sp. NPDC001467 TaxID=3390595 RepID=UPI003D065642
MAKKSPAVEALEQEQAMQRERKAELDEGLENTFPASDPISATGTATAKADQPLAERTLAGGSGASDAPRVDEALETILEHRNDPYRAPQQQVAAVRDEMDSLRYRATGSLRQSIRANPWQAVGLAAFLGFVFGMTR